MSALTVSGAAAVIDSIGRRCPLPIVDLARAISSTEVGQVLAVVADDPAARHDVPAWCAMRQQEYVGETAASDGTAAYLVRRLS
jgi:TusA-related sulfurtransferase